MRRTRANRAFWACWVISALLLGAPRCPAADDVNDLRKLLEAQSKQLEQQRQLMEQQQKQLEELKGRFEALQNGQDVKPASATASGQPPSTAFAPPPKSLEPGSGVGKKKQDEEEAPQPRTDDSGVKKIIDDYLKENPGAGMPPSVQTGFNAGQGFFIKSAPIRRMCRGKTSRASRSNCGFAAESRPTTTSTKRPTTSIT